MSRISVILISVLLLALASSMAFAGRADGITYESWGGWGDPATKGDIEFADFRVGDMNLLHDEAAEPGASISLHNASGEWASLGFAYPPTDQIVSCIGTVGYRVDFTLAFSQSNYFNNNIWYRTTVSRQDSSGTVVFSSILLGDSRIYLPAGSYNILSEASTVPEPGSLLALFSGLIGLVGSGLRHRR